MSPHSVDVCTPGAAAAVVREAWKLFAPPKIISVSEWADQNRILSSESSAMPGRWRTLPFQRDVFDAFSDPDVHTVVAMTCTQLLKTSLIECCLGYVIDRDPGPALVVFPRDGDADRFSKLRFTTMIRDSPVLRAKVQELATKRTGDTLSLKRFAGGYVMLTASGSPQNLASQPVRYLFGDEIDKFPASAGAEGDPLSLAMKRQATFPNRKTVLCCSPTIGGASRIEKAFLQSDQRRYEAKCPACGAFQVLAWENVIFADAGADAERAATARYRCESCSALWNDLDRHKAVAAGRWTATAPFRGIAGFWISELYSPWKKMSEIVSDFLSKRRDPQQLKTFVNTSLAELWVEKGDQPEWRRIYDKREPYPLGTVPARGLFLVAGADVQADRIEVEVVAYGPEKESWSVDYRVLQGDTSTASSPVWRELEALLARDWPHVHGGTLPLRAIAIDTGYRPGPVYDLAARHPQLAHGPGGSRWHAFRTVVPIKGGSDEFKLIQTVSNVSAARQRGGVKIFTISTHVLKTELYDWLRLNCNLTPAGEQLPTPCYCHFPKYEPSYFQGLVSEKRIVRASGKVEWVADGNIRNEPLDCRIYARAAATLCGLDGATAEDWEKLQLSIMPLFAGAAAPAPPPRQNEERYIPRQKWFEKRG